MSLIAIAIETTGLTKVYRTGLRGRHVGLMDLTLRVDEGTIFGLLGPNGSGKTTTLNLLLGLIFPTSGEGTVLGEPLGSDQYKSRIGFLPDGSYFYDHLNAEELLSFYGSLFGLGGQTLRDKIDELLDMIGMQERRKTRIREYSKGMAQRIGVAQAMLNDPDLVFFDEPTTGLDPLGAKQMRDIIVNLREQGKTVFICSHLLKEMEAICDEIAILDRGSLVAAGSLDDLLHETDIYTVTCKGHTEELRANVEPLADHIIDTEGWLECRVDTIERALALSQALTDGGATVTSVVQGRRSLEDFFIEAVSRREGEAWV